MAVVAVAATAQAGRPAAERADAAARPAAGMTFAEYGRLPPDADIQVGGRTMKKRAFQAEFDRIAAAQRRAGRPVTLAAVEQAFEREQTAKINADNARVQREKSAAVASIVPEMVVAQLPPKITSVFMVPPLVPGEELFIKGTGFGTDKSKCKAFLEGQFPGGRVEITLVELKNEYIHGKVKAVVGVQDQPAKLVIVRDNKRSNLWDATFEATRELKAYQRADFAIVRCHPGEPRQGDACNPAAQSHLTTVFNADHRYGDFDVGFDQVSVHVGNGWLIDSAHLDPRYAYLASPQGQFVAGLGGLQPHTTDSSLRVDWVYAGLGGINYMLQVVVKGPKGTSYK